MRDLAESSVSATGEHPTRREDRWASLLARVTRWTEAAAWLAAALGAVLILVQAFWVTYGVFMRYVLRNPDGTVTEATELLLLPLAFAGLAWALREDANPKVTLLLEHLPAALTRWIEAVNGLVVALVGAFFVALSAAAALSSWRSGSASSIIGWPEYALWTPVAACALAFTLLALLRLVALLRVAIGGAPLLER